MRRTRRRGWQRARDGRQACGGRRQGHEGGPRIPGTGRVQGAGYTGAGSGGCSPATWRQASSGPRRRAPGGPRRRNARATGTALAVSFGDVFLLDSFLRSGGRPRRARHGAGEAGVLRARRPRRPPRRGLAAPTYARLPCPRARMASQEVSEHVEHVDDPHLTAHRTLPLDVERAGQRTVHCHSVVNVRHVQGRVAVPPSLPLGGERTALVRSGPSGSASGTFVVEWQCVSHCHSVVSVLSGAPYTATRW